MPTKKLRYLDNASTTPLDPRVLKAMLPYLTKNFGNPSNLYRLGLEAKRAVGTATQIIAKEIGCRPDELVYTSSATESDNMAIQGVAYANRDKGKRIIVSQIEHKGVLAVCEALRKEGFEIIELPVGTDALIDVQEFRKYLTNDTILVSLTSVDSETGTIQPITEIGKIIREFRLAQNPNGDWRYPIFHTDASQAAPHLEIKVDALNVDLMTFSAHKMHGPKGIGALYVRRGTPIRPLIYGGGQQGRLRSGTENVPGVVGFGEAMRLAAMYRGSENKRLAALRDRLEKGITKTIPKIVINGSRTHRLPNMLNVSFLDVEGEAMLLYLDEEGICINTGSACNSESLEPSYVLTALGSPYEFVHGSIRFSLGRTTTKEDIDFVLKKLPPIIERLRQISPLNLSVHQKSDMSTPKAFVGGKTPHFLRKKKK